MSSARLDLRPDATVEAAVARRVGYSNGFALSTAFKRVRGISPTEHRRAPSADRYPSPVPTSRLRITLRDVSPAVVRVIDVPETSTLPELHDLLQAALGWTDSHLHQFVAGDRTYGVADPDWGDELHEDEAGVKLRDLPTRFVYRYDLGDCWEHDVEMLGSGGDRPGCVDGAGGCPPEDCGGAPGHEELLAVLADPDHERHHEMREWAGELPTFDRAAVDVLLRRTAGEVPASVRLVLDLLAGGVKLTPGGRLPRSVVRQVQEQRPHWYPLGRPASVEEDLFPLAVLHEMLRHVRLLRLAKGVLAARVHSLLDERWSVNGRPLSTADVESAITRLGAQLEALDLVEGDWRTWRAGPSARTLLPRATALAEMWSRSPAW